MDVVAMGRIWEGSVKPVVMMVMVQMSLAGVNIFYKLAAHDGFSLKVLVAYRFMFASAFIVPLALIFERNKRPKLTWFVLFQAFICGLFGGSLAQNLYIESLILTSATFAAATTNLVPPITFVIAIFLRLENLALGTRAGQAKVVGTLLGITGAMLLTFYKGVEINIWSTHIDLLRDGQHEGGHMAPPHRGSMAHILGPLLALGACLVAAFGFIFQAQMSKRYPCPYSSTALISLMGLLQSVVYALCVERDWSQWKLGWNIRLLTVAYSGVIVSGLMVTFIMSCVRLRGPLFVSIFNPLMLVLVAIAASLLINEKLHLGSVLGGVIIIMALYMVLWGKSKELKKKSDHEVKPSSQNSVEGAENGVNNSAAAAAAATTNILAVAPTFVLAEVEKNDICVEEDIPLVVIKCEKREENPEIDIV